MGYHHHQIGNHKRKIEELRATSALAFSFQTTVRTRVIVVADGSIAHVEGFAQPVMWSTRGVEEAEEKVGEEVEEEETVAAFRFEEAGAVLAIGGYRSGYEDIARLDCRERVWGVSPYNGLKRYGLGAAVVG